MQIVSNELTYTITRRNLNTGRLEFLDSYCCFGRDLEDCLKIKSASWSKEFKKSVPNKEYMIERLKGIKKYCSEPDYFYGIYEVKKMLELTEVELEEN